MLWKKLSKPLKTKRAIKMYHRETLNQQVSLRGKTLFITGGSRGIGRAIALKAAQNGAQIVIASKTAEPHPKLEGTIFSVAEEIKTAGGKALPPISAMKSKL
jgi:citronellol/citronellal dehydrogenase